MLPKTFSWRYDPDYTWHAARYFESNQTATLGLPRYLRDEIERCRDPHVPWASNLREPRAAAL